MRENGLKLRTKMECAKILFFTNSTHEEYKSGDMLIVGNTIGVLVEAVGATGYSPSKEFPNGPDGVLVYEAEKIYLPKKTGEHFCVGETVYFSQTLKVLTRRGSVALIPCGIAIEVAELSEEQVFVDLCGRGVV